MEVIRDDLPVVEARHRLEDTKLELSVSDASREEIVFRMLDDGLVRIS